MTAALVSQKKTRTLDLPPPPNENSLTSQSLVPRLINTEIIHTVDYTANVLLNLLKPTADQKQCLKLMLQL